jgi:hypothetical protein
MISVFSLQHVGLERLLITIDVALLVDPLVESSFRLPQSEASNVARAVNDEELSQEILAIAEQRCSND